MSSFWIRDKLLSKVERAEKHIHDVQAEWSAFLAEDPYPFFHEDNVQTGERVYYLRSARDAPTSLPLIVGDAIHNLRSALDHLAYHLVCAGNSCPGPFTHVYFPIAENAAKYMTASPGKVKGIGKDAIKAIDAIEPYGGGSGEIFWHLHTLDVSDKHRLLITVGAQNSSHSMAPSERAEIATGLFGLSANDPVPDGRAFLTDSKIIHFPLKAGDKLHTVPRDEVEDDMHFAFEIAFGEPEIVKGKSVIVTLKHFEHLVRHTIWHFYRNGLL
jgi:hypothetical protein